MGFKVKEGGPPISSSNRGDRGVPNREIIAVFFSKKMGFQKRTRKTSNLGVCAGVAKENDSLAGIP